MPQQVCNGATLQCAMGMAPSTLVVLPVNRVNTGQQPDANIMERKKHHLLKAQDGPSLSLHLQRESAE